ncbi:hypothetical protein GOP47_0026765 [Adiantum capillus-veneris]|nr:hypothetical protein GOP47_0026765 [Adiantum capillus-veneris]
MTYPLELRRTKLTGFSTTSIVVTPLLAVLDDQMGLLRSSPKSTRFPSARSWSEMELAVTG